MGGPITLMWRRLVPMKVSYGRLMLSRSGGGVFVRRVYQVHEIGLRLDLRMAFRVIDVKTMEDFR
jgi:hypothetical protein